MVIKEERRWKGPAGGRKVDDGRVAPVSDASIVISAK
jgi:hypothetical protein